MILLWLFYGFIFVGFFFLLCFMVYILESKKVSNTVYLLKNLEKSWFLLLVTQVCRITKENIGGQDFGHLLAITPKMSIKLTIIFKTDKVTV